MASGSSIKPPAPDGMEPRMVSDAVEDTDKPLSAVPAATAGDERWDASAQKVGMSGAAAAAAVVDAGDKSVAPTTSISNPKSLPTPTKSETKGGSGGTARDIEEKPMRLTSLMIGYLGLVDAFSFSYIDQAGKKHSVGPWGEGYHHDKIETISFDPSEFVEEVFGTYGSHFGNILVMSLTFVTNVKTYGPFGNPYHQNVPATPFRFMADEGSCIVGFHGRSGSHLFSIGVYMTTVRALSAPVILRGQYESLETQLNMLKVEVARLKIDAEAYRCHRQCSDDQASKAFVYIKPLNIDDAINNRDPFAKGGFGIVYKAELGGRDVAIKVPKDFNLPKEKRAFHKEVEILRRIRHPYIVILHGACLEKCALVYEFLPNGTLEERLEEGKGNEVSFPWEERIHVAANISTALVYLHDSSPHPITHADLKPNNILFDAENICKLGDFGISRFMQHNTTGGGPCHNTDEPMGSGPYMDPDNVRYKKLTCLADQFAFGIILLELVTCARASGLRKLVSEKMKTFDGKLRDEKIRILSEDGLMDTTWKSNDKSKEVALEMLALGLRCSEEKRKDRPDFKTEVWTKIKSITCEEVPGIAVSLEYHYVLDPFVAHLVIIVC